METQGRLGMGDKKGLNKDYGNSGDTQRWTGRTFSVHLMTPDLDSIQGNGTDSPIFYGKYRFLHVHYKSMCLNKFNSVSPL